MFHWIFNHRDFVVFAYRKLGFLRILYDEPSSTIIHVSCISMKFISLFGALSCSIYSTSLTIFNRRCNTEAHNYTKCENGLHIVELDLFVLVEELLLSHFMVLLCLRILLLHVISISGWEKYEPADRMINEFGRRFGQSPYIVFNHVTVFVIWLK